MDTIIYEDLATAMLGCTSDIAEAADKKKISLEMQIRAYDLFDRLMETGWPLSSMSGSDSLKAAQVYCSRYDAIKEIVDAAYDEESLGIEVETLLASLRADMNNLRFEAASAASLHEFAKEVFDIWQTSGIFARRRALRELRERAGFRLESHRIGNYVAKTFDLMNEAQARFARAQQTLFAADVKYKIKPDIYKEIYNLLSSQKL